MSLISDSIDWKYFLLLTTT